MQQPLGESPLVIIQTRCPVEIIRYMKGLAMLKYGKLMVMNEEMLKQFNHVPTMGGPQPPRVASAEAKNRLGLEHL